MRGICFIAAAAATMLSSPTHAQSSAKVMLRAIDAGGRSADNTKMWMHGIETGLRVANVQLEGRKQKPFYCHPGKLALTGDQVVEITRDFVKENPRVADVTAGLVVFWALKDTFPCKQGK